ncbi:MAG: ABC transporter permease [Thermoplasmata archaeon]
MIENKNEKEEKVISNLKNKKTKGKSIDSMKLLFTLPGVSTRAWKVWHRNADVFMKTYKTNFIPPFIEPILYLVGLGFGLGGFVSEIEGVSYPVFLAPALIAISVMNTASGENTYASYVRMSFQKTFDAIIATPVSIEDVIAGEMLWGATKGLVNASIMLVVIAAFGLLLSPLAILIIPFSMFVGLVFSAISMCFTAIVPNIDSFNYYFFLFVTPMFIFSGTFFPISSMPAIVQRIAFFLPLTPAVTTMRAFATGNVSIDLIYGLIYLLILLIFLFVLAINLMKKRLII